MTSSGSDWSPASIKMNAKPMNCHAWMPATASIAQLGDWAIPGDVSIPSHCIRPFEGLRIVKKMTLATAIDVIAVEAKVTWKNATPRSFWLANTARARPATTPIGTAIATKIAVARSESRNDEDVITEVNCEVPTYFEGLVGYGPDAWAATLKFLMNG